MYGKQWRSWSGFQQYEGEKTIDTYQIDQISDLIKQLKENPDSRRLLVSAWNPADLEASVLPPCHYGFQVYTRELTNHELNLLYSKRRGLDNLDGEYTYGTIIAKDPNIPRRAISLMFNMRSVDTFLGLPFNIASYGLLLEIIAKAVNMIPDELIGNLGDVHLYSNHIEQAKEQIGRKLSLEERHQLALPIWKEKYGPLADMMVMTNVDNTPYKIPRSTREPYLLPQLNINTEFWPTESGECGIGAIDAVAVFNNFTNEHFCKCLLNEDIQLVNYQSHSIIKAPLSN